MVTANELRIDNWVIFNDNTDRYGQILELHKYYAPLKCGYIPDHGENLVIGTTVDYEHLFPIPLTPEILEKWCGFIITEDSNIRYSHNDKIALNTYLKEDVGYYWLRYYQNMVQPKIKHLHQLQNLYFALTNEELKISFT